MNIKNIETDKQNTIEQLIADNKLKTKWLSLIAHDFKGLFSNIQLLLNAFADMSISQEVLVSMLPELQQTAENCSKILESTFAWVNSQTNGFKPHLEDVLVHDLFLELKEIFDKEIQVKELLVRFAGDKEVTLSTDRFLFMFIVKQLVENAIKYSNKRGLIEVIAHSHSNLNKVVITIKDKGVGIKESVINDIGTLDGAVYTGTMQEKGAGLRLVVVKEFVEMLKGQMRISSIMNEGTSVELIFSTKTT